MTQQAPSPFIEGTFKQWAWNSSSLGVFKACPRKYYYTVIKGYRTSGEESVHLLFGGWYASALESYHKLRATGHSYNDAVCAVVRETLIATWLPEIVHEDENIARPAGPWVSNDANKTRETLIRTIVWYLDQFADDDPLHTWHLDNGKPAVELTFKMEIDNGLLLCGHLDRVVDYNGDLYITDNKTTKSTISPHYFRQFEPNNQMTLYTLAAQVVFGAPVKGVIIDAAQIAVGFSRFERGFTFRTQGQLNEFLDASYIWIAQAHECAEREYWPMNESACHDYGGCQFRDICGKDPAIRQRFLDSNFHVAFRNPLEEF